MLVTRTSNICTFYEYDAAGRTTKVIDARGRSNLTFYDAAGRTYLTVQNYNGATYTDPLTLCNWANPHSTNNLCHRTEYDNFGRVIKMTDPLGRVTRTEYDSLGRVKGTIQNSVTVSQLSQCWFPPAPNYRDRDLCTLYTYDPAGNLLITQDPVGRLTRTFYDELNRVVGQVQNWTANGPIQTFANLQSSCFGLPADRTSNICTATTYDNVGNAIIHTDPMGRMTRTFYDEVGRVQTVVQNWQTGFDPANCVYDANNMATANICTSYGYDEFGRQQTTTNALDQTSLTVYDTQSRPFISVANWDRVTVIANESHCSFAAGPRSSNICTVTDYDPLGRRSATKNGLGQITEYGYDALGHQTSTTRYLNGTPITTSTQLDVLGNRLSSTDARNHTTTYTYDTLNRLTSTTSPMGVWQGQSYNAAGWVLESDNAGGHVTEYEYDLFGRLLTTTDPLNHTTTLAYDHLGNQTRQTDALTIVTSYQYDALNRLVGVKENDTGGAPTPQSNVLTQYSYDILGNRTGVTNAHGKFSEVAYDVLGRPVTVTNALQQQTTYTYDALGKVRQMVDGNGAITNYTYDGLNRLTSTTYVQDNETVSHTYDALGNRLTLSDNTGVTNYTYDSLNRLTNISRGMSITTYGYDHNGNRTSLTYPDGKSVTYTYDKDNRLTQVNGWGGQQASYTYDKLGRLYTTTLPNGVVTTHSYDDANRLTQIKHQNSQLLTSYTYTLNPVGNRTQVVETQTLNGVPTTPTTIHYTYDPLHRLTHASYGGILPEYQYTYDAVGNITQSTENSVTTAKTYNDANQLVSSTSAGQTTTYTYNGAGNLTQTQVGAGTVTYYSYNQRNLLLSQATSPSLMGLIKLNATFVYDGNGDRVQEMAYTNGQLASTTTYTNDPVGLTQVLVANKNGQQTHNLWGMDLLAQDDGQAQKLTLLTDALGSVRGQMRGTSLQSSTSYGPYGSIHQQTGTSQTSYGYTGEQFHAGTGLLYLRARYYSPALHAFTTRDPWAGEPLRPASLNGYNYAEANPILYTDPTGWKIWQSASSFGEKATGWLHERRNPFFVHLEFNRLFSPSGHSLRPDIIHSHTGSVYEVEPFYGGKISWLGGFSEALYYTDLLNYQASLGTLPRPNTAMGIYNDFNLTKWRLGDPAEFLPVYHRSDYGTILPSDPSVLTRGVTPVVIPAGFDFMAVSPAPGIIVWWIQPNEKVTVALLAAALANNVWKEHILKDGEIRPPNSGNLPRAYPVPVPATISVLDALSQVVTSVEIVHMEARPVRDPITELCIVLWDSFWGER
ncbi:MAG: hypothetical protein OT477_12480 [Chloroflexi bacterium]|nr:hypothetical protein [Chloroflexota bacterium]